MGQGSVRVCRSSSLFWGSVLHVCRQSIDHTNFSVLSFPISPCREAACHDEKLRIVTFLVLLYFSIPDPYLNNSGVPGEGVKIDVLAIS
jgi:hypothetical protein